MQTSSTEKSSSMNIKSQSRQKLPFVESMMLKYFICNIYTLVQILAKFHQYGVLCLHLIYLHDCCDIATDAKCIQKKLKSELMEETICRLNHIAITLDPDNVNLPNDVLKKIAATVVGNGDQILILLKESAEQDE